VTRIQDPLRLKAARKLKHHDAPRDPVRRLGHVQVTWADWDEELLSLELQRSTPRILDLDLHASTPKRSHDLGALPTRRRLNETHAVPEHPGPSGDLWICGKHRISAETLRTTSGGLPLGGPQNPS